ncbi:matrix-remodeling-associated protein 7 isoform 2-T2 [Rhinophrynus dorsalis]
MELEGDFSFVVPLLFTAIAVVLATLLIKLRSSSTGEKPKTEVVEEEKEKVSEILKTEERGEVEKAEESAEREEGKIPVEEVGACEASTVKLATEESTSKEAAEELPTEGAKQTEAAECTANEKRASSEEEDDSKEEELEVESDKILKITEADDADDEESAFKYCPGKLRGSDFEKMLTKDELAEEQRPEDVMKLPLQSS